MPTHHDSDTHKGAVESESPADASKQRDQNTSLSGQLPHRNADPFIKDHDTDNDTDYPEQSGTPEHSGQRE
ncbi:hypothetical protein [Acidobacterium sp. S8]|uniref:hypothetical protein n=1 Tax=Acidobacterium sp. S8 TaxID=1641854 RepID=UPI00131CDD43|nr:hypothetical protein [Acidobacterium sp. S8]